MPELPGLGAAAGADAGAGAAGRRPELPGFGAAAARGGGAGETVTAGAAGLAAAMAAPSLKLAAALSTSGGTVFPPWIRAKAKYRSGRSSKSICVPQVGQLAAGSVTPPSRDDSKVSVRSSSVPMMLT